MLLSDGSVDVVIESLSSSSARWVVMGSDLLVVTLDVLVEEVGVAELGEAKVSEKFVVPLLVVEEFVTVHGVQAAEES